MFVPKMFQVKDVSEVIQFIQENSFGILVSNNEGKSIATHIPFQLTEAADGMLLTTHVAKANPQWRGLEGETVLVIFQGPHAYVSASWYTHENVSTWNYQAVHVYGKVRLLNEVELEQDLTKLLAKYEKGRVNRVSWEGLSEKAKAMKQGVVGICVEVLEVEAAFKMSQNRSDADYLRVIEGLETENDRAANDVADLMRKMRKEEQ